MTASHGREVRTLRAWLAASLVASGLSLGSAARADQIHPDANPADPVSGAPMPPTDLSPPGPGDALKDWHPSTMVVPPDVNGYSAPTSGMTSPAADFLVPQGSAAPSVANWHHIHANMCMPPTPPPCAGGASMADPTPPSSLPAPAGLQSSPTPAPEPSTILSALALVGAIAWRRRSRG